MVQLPWTSRSEVWRECSDSAPDTPAPENAQKRRCSDVSLVSLHLRRWWCASDDGRQCRRQPAGGTCALVPLPSVPVLSLAPTLGQIVCRSCTNRNARHRSRMSLRSLPPSALWPERGSGQWRSRLSARCRNYKHGPMRSLSGLPSGRSGPGPGPCSGFLTCHHAA